jgi:Xaa-Pro aminopeptidase
VSDLTNIAYLTGFTSSFSLFLVGLKETVFFTDFRYIETAEKNVRADAIIRTSHDYLEEVKTEVRKRKIRRLGFESRVLSHAQYAELAGKVGEKKLVPLKDKVENLRAVKEEQEVSLIRKAVSLTERALRHIRTFFEPGVSEKDLAVELEVFFKLNGGGQTDFQPIVAFGEGSSMPHYVGSTRKLRMSDILLIDLGTSVEGYHADLTRTWLSRTMKPKEKEIYTIVLDAQQAAIDRIRPGVKLVSIDRAARELISKSGYGENFGHGLGHGLGLKVHELPRISAKSEGICRKGMVVTIEPGIYIPGWGGVRIEDDILVTEKGCEVLSSFPKVPRPFM